MSARVWYSGLGAAARAVALSVLSPLMEKNRRRVRGVSAPVVLSMSRVIVLAFAAGMLREIWGAGVAGWPEATLSMAIVLALPILNALERASPRDVLAVAAKLLGRFGVGSVRTVANVYGTEPSKYDDHTNDGTPMRGVGRRVA